MQTLTVLEAGRLTAFRYRIEGGMDDRDRDEIDAMDSGYVLGMDWPSIVSDSVDIRHRVHYMRRRHLGFGFVSARDRNFEDELISIDPELPKVLAEIVADLYLNGTRMLSDHADNIEAETPRNTRERGWCHALLKKYLAHLNPDADLERAYVYRMPALFEDNFDVSGNRRDGFYTDLVFGIAVEQ